MNEISLVKDLGEVIYNSIKDSLGHIESKKIDKIAESGDVTFRLDTLAEDALYKLLREKYPEVAYYSEDRGLVSFSGKPSLLLIVDPIDGTRPATCGFESAVISIALADYCDNPAIKDVRIGYIREVKSEVTYIAEKGKGVKIEGAQAKELILRNNVNTECMFWSFEIVGRPIKILTKSMGKLIEESSLSGGIFIFNSSAYSLTRLLTGQLDAHIDIAARFLREFPKVRNDFLKAGKGRIVSLFPYDIAAAVLIAEEGGCVVTDAYGQSLDNLPIFNPREDQLPTLVAASNKKLHQKILEKLDFN